MIYTGASWPFFAVEAALNAAALREAINKQATAPMRPKVDPQEFAELCAELGIDPQCDEIRRLRSPHGTGYAAVWDKIAAQACGNCPSL